MVIFHATEGQRHKKSSVIPPPSGKQLTDLGYESLSYSFYLGLSSQKGPQSNIIRITQYGLSS